MILYITSLIQPLMNENIRYKEEPNFSFIKEQAGQSDVEY